MMKLTPAREGQHLRVLRGCRKQSREPICIHPNRRLNCRVRRCLKQSVQGNLLLWLLICILTGCTNGPRVDWNSRMGKYSFDQAVLELGPPDKSARLTDGTTVAEWLIRRGYSAGHYPILSGPVYYPYILNGYDAGPSPDRFLRLVFDPHGKLAIWKNYYK